jgi:Tfp pilus assembly protein PilX
MNTKKKHSGIALITSMIFLVAVMTIAALAMKDISLSEKSAGNLLEKQRSLHSAESALRYSEWWLSLNNHGIFKTCDDIVNGNDVSSMRVCKNSLQHIDNIPWETYATYKPQEMSITSTGGLRENGDINYSAPPNLHIKIEAENRRGKFFHITTAGFGGNDTTRSIIESTFFFSVNSVNLGEL